MDISENHITIKIENFSVTSQSFLGPMAISHSIIPLALGSGSAYVTIDWIAFLRIL